MKLSLIALSVILSLWLTESDAHDHARADLDRWYESLKVPNDGLPLKKGVSCCHKQDCKPRQVRSVAPGYYRALSDTGEWLPFTDLAQITDPAVLRNRPYFAWVVCINQGHVVCFVRGRTGL